MRIMRNQPLILVVDDESHILHVVRLKLKNAGYEVVTAEDGEEGAAAALEHQPDLIISDYQMPFMSGLEMCLKLREYPATRFIPAVMLTARGFTLSQQQLEQAHIAAVLSKPFSPRDILTHVRELLSEQSQADQQERFSTP